MESCRFLRIMKEKSFKCQKSAEYNSSSKERLFPHKTKIIFRYRCKVSDFSRMGRPNAHTRPRIVTSMKEERIEIPDKAWARAQTTNCEAPSRRGSWNTSTTGG